MRTLGVDRPQVAARAIRRSASAASDRRARRQFRAGRLQHVVAAVQAQQRQQALARDSAGKPSDE